MRKLILIILVLLMLPGLITGIWLLTPKAQGFLQLAPPGARLRVEGGWWVKYEARSEGGATPMLARTYQPRMLNISATQGGVNWSAVCFGPWGEINSFKIVPGQTCYVDCGPPFVIKAEVQQSGRQLVFTPLITGKAGEAYESFTRSGKQVIPTYEILDEKENVMASGKFEYG